MPLKERMVQLIPWVTLLSLTFVLKGYECVTPGTCTDLMFVDNKRTIHHGVIKTVTGDSKTGIVLRETILESDNNVYFAYISPICKIGNFYRYNCLALKTFTSYTDMYQNNYKYCHDKEVRINAECRMASMRVINGVIFCELEPGNYATKPRIAHINMTTGEIIRTRELTDAKQTTLCLKTRENDWNPNAQGKIGDVTVQTMVDGTETWIVYEAANGAKSIAEQLNPDLSRAQNIVIDKIGLNNRVILICGKIYIMPVSPNSKNLWITKAVDLYNSNNHMSRTVKLINDLPEFSLYSWVHYNPKLNELFVGLKEKDSFVFNVARCDYNQEDTRSIDLTNLKSTFLWSLSATEPNHLTTLVDTVTSFFKITNITELDYTTRLLLKCPLRACSLDSGAQSTQYCRIKNTIITLKTYSDYKQVKPAARTLLQIHFHMDRILNQQNYKTVASKLNVLQTFMSKGFTELKVEIDALRTDIGSYFTSLADFDRSTAESDMNLIYRYLGEFKNKTATLGTKVNDAITTLVTEAKISSSLELITKTTYLLISTTAFANPIDTMVGTSSAILDVQEAMDAVAKQSAIMTKLTKLETYLPKMREMAGNLSAHAKANAIKYKTIRDLVNQAIADNVTETKLKNISAQFLHEYDNYEPGFLPSTISDVEEIMSAIVEELCEIIFGGDTAASSAAQIAFHSKGTCFNTKIDVKTLMAVYYDMYEKQDALLEAFASAVRASIARLNAERIKTIRDKVDTGQIVWTHVNLKVYTLELFVSSEVHRLVLVHEACNLVKYKNAGIMPDYCRKVIINPQGTSFDTLIAYKFDQNMCDRDEISKYVTIPAKEQLQNNTLPAGTIDLKALYQGNETYFKIPNRAWLVSNGWISTVDNPTMIILKKFELYLPFMQNTSTLSSVTVRSTLKLSGRNPIAPGGPSYDFNVDMYQYKFRYNQKDSSCFKPLGGVLPYEIPGCTKPSTICLLSRGLVDNAIYYPSIYSRWSLKTSVQGNLAMPKPKGDFSLSAKVSFCFVNPTKLSSRDIKEVKRLQPENKPQIDKRTAVCCATSGKYYDAHNQTTHCQSCPQGSAPKLQGYYCG